MIPVLLAACLLGGFISSTAAINCEDGTEYAQIFNIEEARYRGEKDERWQSEKMKGTELYTITKHCGAYSPSPYILALANKHGI